MNAALWISQIVLAAVFTFSGALKLVMSKERMLATGQTGVRDYALPAIRMIAACEIAGCGIGPGEPRSSATAASV